MAGRPLVIDQVSGAMMKEGVFCIGWVSHLVVAPPLIVTREELDRGLTALDRALTITDAKVESAG